MGCGRYVIWSEVCAGRFFFAGIVDQNIGERGVSVFPTFLDHTTRVFFSQEQPAPKRVHRVERGGRWARSGWIAWLNGA